MLLKDHTSLNPPPRHSFEGDTVHVETGKETEFWRETFYGFGATAVISSSPASVDVGIMCCSPQRESFRVSFSE